MKNRAQMNSIDKIMFGNNINGFFCWNLEDYELEEFFLTRKQKRWKNFMNT